MTPYSRYWFIYVLATITATCFIDCVFSKHYNRDNDEHQKAPRQLKSENQFQSDSSDNSVQCGGTFTARYGIIQTPAFPNKFPVPITCVWIIDASELVTGPNISILIYPTQLYVLGGLEFTEYMYYGNDFKVRSTRVFQFSEQNVTKVSWIQFNSPYLKISFTMKTLYGNHLRALDHLLDVYGFNITYEVGQLKSYQCNALKCRFLGHCYAQQDFSSYYCSCFPGYSGSDCGQGPLCEQTHQNVCSNGGTCRHVGASAVSCTCPTGFRGNRCEIRDFNDETDCSAHLSMNCQKHCLSLKKSSHFENLCTCSSSGKPFPEVTNRTENWRYQITIRFTNNLTILYKNFENIEKRTKEHLKLILERHITRVIRNANISNYYDLEMINMMLEGHDITFHLFAPKSESNKIHEVVSRMIDRGRLGNYTLVSNFLIFSESPPFELEPVVANQPTPIREGSEFILSCVARGSSDIVFGWYKDGFPVNTSLAVRDIWTMMLPPEQKYVYTSLLGVRTSSSLDEGRYTCEATDWGGRKCRSFTMLISSPPQLLLEPPHATVFRGASLKIRCLSPESDHQRYGRLGYSWTKNGLLFQSDPENIAWEDLFPGGSILKINNIQKSMEFTCIVSNSIAPVTKNIHVSVIHPGKIEMCPEQISFGVKWPLSLPGPPVITNCPTKYVGQAKRTCELHDVRKPGWLLPDFSDCVADALINIHSDAIASGYQKTNCLSILQACLDFVIRRHLNFLPGEGKFMLEFLLEIEHYLQLKGSIFEKEMASEITLHILDKIIQNADVFSSKQQVQTFQLLTQSAALNYETVSASRLVTFVMPESSPASILKSSPSTSSTSFESNNMIKPSTDENSFVSPVTMPLERIRSFRIFKSSVKHIPFHMQIYSRDISDLVNVNISTSSYIANILSTSQVQSMIISYDNLVDFLPKRYSNRNSDGDVIDFMLASRIITSNLYQSNRSNDDTIRLLNLPLNIGLIEIIFQHENKAKDPKWFPICGYDVQTTDYSSWQTDSCITKKMMENMTRCICPLSGTFVVLLAKKNSNSPMVQNFSRPTFMIISCGCCFFQSCLTFVILIPILYSRKCCITFLKMQFCTSTSTVMAILILGFLKQLPQDWHGVVSSTLASLLLLGLSSLVAITLIVQSELVPKKAQMANLSSGIRGAFCVSWLLPVLFAISSPLIYTIIGKWPLNWWLESGSSGFILFVIVEILFVLLFAMLFAILLTKLLYLARKYDKQSVFLWKRIGLLYRTGVLVVLKMTTDILILILPNNASDSTICHIFGISCISLGSGILICFVMKAEYNLKTSLVNKNSSKAIINDIFCSAPPTGSFGFYSGHDFGKIYEKNSSPQTNLKLSTAKEMQATVAGASVEALMKNEEKSLQDISLHELKPPTSSILKQHCSAATCCSILRKGSTKQFHLKINETEALSNNDPPECKSKFIAQNSRDSFGVESLDILKGVSQGSIIGIRDSLSSDVTGVNVSSQICNEQISAPVDKYPTTSRELKLIAEESQCMPSESSSYYYQLSPPIIKISYAAQEPPAVQSTKDFSHQQPREASVESANSNNDINIDGMLHRISHDLDFLLNRSQESPIKCNVACKTTKTDSSSSSKLTSFSCETTHVSKEKISNHKLRYENIHEAIIEEPETGEL